LCRPRTISHPAPHPLRSPTLCHPARPPPELHPLSLHDALPISVAAPRESAAFFTRSQRRSHETPLQGEETRPGKARSTREELRRDRKSTRLNSSHGSMSYAVFCSKKKTMSQRKEGSSTDGGATA